MQISPSNPALVSPLNGSPIGPEKNGKALQGAAQELTAPRNDPPAPVTPELNDTDTVSISATPGTLETDYSPAPVYAEIWKGSIKVAQVDIHGHVTSHSGMVASGGGGIAGPLLAAQRAVQVAQQTGGEIRTAGQTLDSQTLLMRARLANAYTT
jgi:hypothetical protein